VDGLSFRPMEADDLRLLYEWLQRPHIRRWWSGEAETYQRVVEHYLPSIEGAGPTDLYVLLLGGRPSGFVQTYRLSDYPAYAALVGAEEGAAGVDLFISEPELTSKGIGTRVLRRFVEEIVFSRPATTHCLADPDVRNVASLRAFEKAGFRVVTTFFDPEDRYMHALVRLDRP
jgi:aminoglycoside 6'-N-acetyltransferase